MEGAFSTPIGQENDLAVLELLSGLRGPLSSTRAAFLFDFSKKQKWGSPDKLVGSVLTERLSSTQLLQNDS